jgi:hypothetical protein
MERRRTLSVRLAARVTLGAAAASCSNVLGISSWHDVAGDAESLPSPLLVYYRFDGDALDASGHGANGTLLGKATLGAPGVSGSALSCSRTGDGLSFAPDAFEPGMSSFSIALFARAALNGAGDLISLQNTLFNKGGAWNDSANRGVGTGFGLWFGGGVLSLEATVRDGPAPGTWQTASTAPPASMPIADGHFHHFAMVVDREANQFSVYSDGAVRAVRALPPGFGSVSSPEPGTLCTMLDSTLDGAVDEFMIIGRALDADEIAALAARFPTGS